MRNIFPLTFIFFLFFSHFSFAQNSYTQIFIIELNNPECYPFSDFPTSDLATQQFLSDYLGFSVCATDCTFPTYPSCEAVLINQNALEKTEDQWCFVGEIKFGWLCQEPVNGEEGQGEDKEEEKKEEDGEKKEEDGNRAAAVEESFATITLSPNPSTGLCYLSISPQQTPSQVSLIIHDGTGQLIKRNTYEVNASANLSLPIDLSAASPGIYFVSIKINGTIVKTSKLLMQM